MEVITAAETWLDGQTSEFFLTGLQKLEQRTRSILSFVVSMLNKSRVLSLYLVSFLIGLRTYQHPHVRCYYLNYIIEISIANQNNSYVYETRSVTGPQTFGLFILNLFLYFPFHFVRSDLLLPCNLLLIFRLEFDMRRSLLHYSRSLIIFFVLRSKDLVLSSSPDVRKF